ncbi:MAG: SLBB domain-containing protein [Kiritimatiellae bacterium]|nr:SLBB domain-containing protein [Kiritimatiellia bacterium]
MKIGRWFLTIAFVVLAGLSFSGCAGSSTGDQRMARYRPDGSQRRPWEWAYATASPAAPVADPTSSTNSTGTYVVPTPMPDEYAGVGEELRRGDGIVVYLKNIPRPEDIREEVDAVGAVTLPLIGKIHVTGMTTTQAEDAIKKAYIDGGFYRKIDVIVVADAGSYYVRGEVKRPGSFPISGDVTLVQAITTAGGYTDFARRTKVKVRRGQEDKTFDADRIEDGKDPDPLIKANDTIIVPRRWM